MKEKAIAKLKGEMNSSQANSYVTIIGGFLLRYIEVNPHDSEKILDDKKTIAGSLNEMMKVAKGKKQGNFAVLTDAEGYEIVGKYFGFTGKITPAMMIPEMNTVPVIEAKKAVPFNVKLEDFLS